MAILAWNFSVIEQSAGTGPFSLAFRALVFLRRQLRLSEELLNEALPSSLFDPPSRIAVDRLSSVRPDVRYTGLLRIMLDGKYPRTRPLRRGDEFLETFEVFMKVIESLKRRDADEVEKLVRTIAAARQKGVPEVELVPAVAP
jgi:hypothetical protein